VIPLDKLSYSRLDTFHTCPRAFWYAYVDGDRGGDNVYSYMGTIVHEVVEGLVSGTVNRDDAKQRFLDALDDVEVLGFEWASDKSKDGYREDILHFIEHFDPSYYTSEPHIEETFDVTIGGYPFHGFIDCWFETADTIIIEDFKTSSKYSKSDLEAHSMQLAVYAKALEQTAKEKNKKIVLRFNMLKYYTDGKKIVERCGCDVIGDPEPGFVYVDYNEALSGRLEQWVIETMHKIESIDPSLYYRWPKSKSPMKDFFCKKICSHYPRCSGIAG